MYKGRLFTGGKSLVTGLFSAEQFLNIFYDFLRLIKINNLGAKKNTFLACWTLLLSQGPL